MTHSIDNVLGLGLLRQPKAVFFGPGQRALLPSIIRPLANRVLICTDERMSTTEEFAQIAQDLTAAGVVVDVYSRVEAELPQSNVADLQRTFADTGIDAVIGLGGGSCMDMAKMAGLLLKNGGDIRDYFGENLVPGPGLPVVTVPTTGGTGAEVSCISVVFDQDKGMKVGVASAFLEPHTAVIDPELTLSCPPGLTAATGADALSHLIESFTDRAKNPSVQEIEEHLYVGKNVLTDVWCRHGLALLNTSLERVVAEPTNLQARSDTMFAAFCGGMALNTAGTAAAHAIQSPIGNLTHTAHGFGVGVLLPFVMRYNLPVREAVMAEIAQIFGVATPAMTLREQAQAAILRVEEMLSALGIPSDLRELGLNPEDFSFVAEQSLRATRLTANNPRDVDFDGVMNILTHAYESNREWWGE